MLRAQLALSIFFNPEIRPMRWGHLQFWWVFPGRLTQPRKPLTNMLEGLVSLATAEPVQVMVNINHPSLPGGVDRAVS